MKPIPKEARTQNVRGTDFCRWCADVGLVVFSLRPAKPTPAAPYAKPSGHFEEYAPCPFCEAGYREEFPIPKAGNRRPTTAPWGEGGFWAKREKEDVELVPMYPKGRTYLTVEENKQRALELSERLAGALPNMDS